MNPTIALAGNQVETHAPLVIRRTAAERLVLTLTTLGMIASMAAFVSYEEAISTQLKEGELFASDLVKSHFYYVVYGIQLILFTAAGVLAFLSTEWRTIERGYLLRFALFLGAALLMTARGYSFSELRSTKLLDSTGPYPCILFVLVFVGARRSNWDFIEKAMVPLVIFLSALVFWRIATLPSLDRWAGFANLTGFVNALFWPASWVGLKDYPVNSFARRVRFLPIVIYTLGSLFTQNRLNFVMVIAFLALYIYVQGRRGQPQGAACVFGLTVAVWVGLFAAVFLRDTHAFKGLETVADAFYSRLDEDTRTGQLRRFAENVEPHELLLGRGSLATWKWTGMSPEWRGGTDIGYLTMLFYGGVPLLVTYLLVHLKPAVRVIRKSSDDWQLTAACIVLLWALRMCSSTYPGMSLESYTVLFFVGACIYRERDSIYSSNPYQIEHSFRSCY
jgi:hypothetical protein